MYTCYKFLRARECLRFLINNFKIEKMHIPYYLCDVIRHILFQNECKPIFYHIDDKFMPTITFPKEDFILYPNYFGVCRKNVEQLATIYPKLIVDNAHAFYDEPIGFACFNSGIKFGYGENANLWIKNNCHTKSGTTNVSRVYFPLKQKCRNKFLELHQTYSGINELNINIEKCYPFCYPLLAVSIEDADNIACNLKNNGLIIYRYWNPLPKSYNEYKFYSRLVPIPIGETILEE